MQQRIRKLAIATIGTVFLATVVSAAGSGAVAKLNSLDHGFLADALGTNQLQIDISAYSAKQASSEKVRQFAQTTATELANVAAEMQKANDGLIAKPPPSQQPGPNLIGRTGIEFDQTYVAVMVSYDDAAIGKLRSAIDRPQYSPPIRDMAKNVLPMIQRNEAMAKELKRSLDSKK
jgi:predicted outer membrane protein